MAKLKIIVHEIESGEIVYLPQRLIKGITKSAYITKEYIEEHPRRLMIEYKSKKFSSHGSMEIIDLGIEGID